MLRNALMLAVLFLVCVHNVGATIVHLGFFGEIVSTFPYDGTDATGSFSGTLTMDTDTPDIRPDENNAHYQGAIIEGDLIWNDVSYSIFGPGTGEIYVANNSAVFHDTLAILTSFASDDGDVLTLLLNLRDSTRTVFSDDSFPEYFDLAQFDDLDVTDTNGTFAGIFPLTFGGTAVQGSIEFAQLRPVPLPGTFWLLASTLVASFCYRSSHNTRECLT